MRSFVGTYQSGLPSAPEACLLHMWFRGVRLVNLFSPVYSTEPSDTSRAIAQALGLPEKALEVWVERTIVISPPCIVSC